MELDGRDEGGQEIGISFAPFVMGWIKDLTGGFGWGLATIAACALVALFTTVALGHDPRLERSPEAAE